MQVTETLNEGLKRKLSVTIPAGDLNERLDQKLGDLKGRAQIKGFRPGKVPMSHIKKVYGRSAMSEVMQEAINTGVQDTLGERQERAATQPKIDLSEDQAVINDVLDGKSDLAFEVSYEILPSIELMDFKKIEIVKPVVEVSDEQVDKELDRLYRTNREFETKEGDDAKVEDGDRVGLKFEGKVDGEPFEGGASEHTPLIVGSGEFIPGFEEQLVGLKTGAKKAVKVTFPKDYTNEELAGKEAVFDVEILHISAPEDVALDDEFAKRFGLDDLTALKKAIRDQMIASNESLAQQRIKRQILDALDEGHQFEVPEELVDAEFKSIWDRVVHEIEHHGRSFEDEDTTEEEAKAQYRKIADRRVRLGLVVAEIGNKNEIEVTEEEHQQALIAEVRRFPGQEQQVYDYYRGNPDALAGLRAPIFENKVVDFVTELAKKDEKTYTREELAKLIQEDEAEGAVPDQHHH